MATNNPSAVDITKHLGGMDFPANKKDLEKHASDKGADENVLDAIRGLPEDHFESMADVMHAFGEEQ